MFDNIISEQSQKLLIDFFESNYKNWYFLKNVIHKNSKTHMDLPGYTTDILIKNDDIISNIILDIQTKILNKLNLKIAENRRYKLNALLPPTNSMDETEIYKSIHYDTPLEHLVILYYVNDSDGDTKLFDNKLGNTYQSNLKVVHEIQNGNFSNLELTKSISPSQGKIIVFDGSTFHCPGWPTLNNRYTINYNIFIKPTNKKLL